jgi:NAD(P)-dependent dehydrogenase (short-subunit alcohol dehydrogenase family)
VPKWTAADLPDLSGKVAIVTGASSGLGLETAAALAGAGAQTVLACRDAARGARALEFVRARAPGADGRVLELDLADLSSIRAFAASFSADYGRLDILCNNGGTMMLPYGQTRDGFEIIFGTNHLGPFALTGLLMGVIRRTPGARIVAVGSLTHRTASLDFDDPQWERRRYSRAGAYGASKLANMLFAFELDQRLREHKVDALSVAAHPGYAATNIALGGSPGAEAPGGLWKRLVDIGNRFIAQPAAMGALPILYAAAAPDVEGGDLIGPDGLFQVRGYPAQVDCEDQARDRELAGRLWTLSEELTKVRFL